MKYLGIDFGTKRTGVATSDDAGEFAFPMVILNTDGAVKAIAGICVSEKIDEVVIGNSLAVNEERNEVQIAVERFAAQLGESIKIPIHFEREDFSSVEAHRYQTDAGARDDSAAAIILQRFLDKKKRQG